MGGSRNPRKKSNNKNDINLKSIEPSNDPSNEFSNEPFNEPSNDDSAELSVRKYKDDSDFDEAFKNLLRPIESIAKKNQCEPLQYDLLKELDSYLCHLRESSDGGSKIFVEAALMFQNVILLYQKRVDQLIDFIMKLIAKFRAYRMNQMENNNAGDEIEHGECNKRKKKEKKIKFYPTFEPIKPQISGNLKIFDCKVINLSKRPTVPKIVLNANIKVDNKYSKILPYIFIGNGENIGKKYDFMINCPLNRDLAVNKEFDCPNIEDKTGESSLKYRRDSDPFPMNLMAEDEIDSDDILPSTPDPVVFDQTLGDQTLGKEIRVEFQNNIGPEVIMNTSQVPSPTNDNGDWMKATDVLEENNNYSNKPVVKKKVPKKEDGVWLPTYVVAELQMQMIKIKTGLPIDPAFRKLIRKALEIQRSEIIKHKNKRNKAQDKLEANCFDEELDKRLINGDEPGFKGFESPAYDGECDDVFEKEYEEELPYPPPPENYEKYMEEVLLHDQNQQKMMEEQLEMRKRVQIWHDNLRPILEAEEKRNAFDIHEYGTRILNCFESKGECKSFKDLVGGQQQEEVARFFLSTLMMANTANLKITKVLSGTHGEINIELLKKERHHEELQVNIGNQVNNEQN